MKFKFKIQQYQVDAADAVCDVFEGQPNQGAAAYRRDLGRVAPSRGMEALFGPAQMVAQEGYGNARLVVSRGSLLKNIQAIQRRNQLAQSASLAEGAGPVNLDVEMETGTGKTYVYTKTMFELNRRYGWTKFIVVVPSVAIREGVYQSLGSTEQHFFEQYGKSIRYFIYDSDRLSELDSYSQSADISAMVINMQAFNSSMKEGASNKAARIIFDERDEFGSRRPIDVIAANNPIVIVDEPQKMGKKGGATQRGIERFNPLFVLNYSATHRERHDMVYALDALDAYNQRLVKRIEVKGFRLKNMRGTDGYLYLRDIVVSKGKAPEAVIEFKQMSKSGRVRKATKRFGEGDDVYLATNPPYLEAYRGYVIASGNDGIVPSQDGVPGHVRFLNGEVVQVGEVRGDSAADSMQRLQVRETIKSHLQKEEALFRRGIKCLSLFFIDEVAKYRDVSGDGATVGYGRVFEEEYASLVEERLSHLTTDDLADGSYVRYLRRDDAHCVHDGYFSIDKRGNAVESKKEKKVEREDGIGINDDDARRGYDLILRDKERLLSFKEPVRFIFSHSALREGWDNPNIFQICTLKESGSETSKRQEVGRGMRLCVDQNGDRQDLAALGEDEVQRVNLLTVIASESYEEFAAALQSDIRKGLRERPTKVEVDFFEGRNVAVDGEQVTFSAQDSKDLYKFLLKNDFLGEEDDRPTGELREKIADGSFTDWAMRSLPESLRDEKKIIAASMLLKSVYDPSALDGLVSAAKEKVTENRLNDNFRRREFQELWAAINRKHAYTVSFSDDELRRKATLAIDSDLMVSRLAYTVTSAQQREKTDRTALAAGDAFGRGTSETHELDAAASGGVAYDLVGEVAQAAAITRRSAAAILSGIDPSKFALFRTNPEEFIAKCGRIIKEQKAAMVVDHIEYHEIDQTYDSAIFTTRMPESLARAYRSSKNIQDYVFPDSEVERKFAEELDAASEVVVYAKLPRTFQIPTPVDGYAPDWAIAFRRGSVRHVFFIAETKGSMSSFDLKGVENAKIACAKKLFNEMGTADVRYHNVTTYEDLLDVMGKIE